MLWDTIHRRITFVRMRTIWRDTGLTHWLVNNSISNITIKRLCCLVHAVTSYHHGAHTCTRLLVFLLPPHQVFQTNRQIRACQRVRVVGLRGERRRLPGLHQHAAERESQTPRQNGSIRTDAQSDRDHVTLPSLLSLLYRNYP